MLMTPEQVDVIFAHLFGSVVATNKTSSMSCIPALQTPPARTAKRQRQREHRRRGWDHEVAATTADSVADDFAGTKNTFADAKQPGRQRVDIDTPVVQAAAGLQLVVRNTFLELQCDHTMMQEYEVDSELALVYANSWERFAQLQPSEFYTTDEIEEQRRAYRLFRAARVMSSKFGMSASHPLRSLGDTTTQMGKEAALGAVSYPLTSPAVLHHSCTLEKGSEADEPSSHTGSPSRATGRAAKRQRQRQNRVCQYV